MTEEWRNIVGYENTYQISNLGNVRRLPCVRSNRNFGKKLLKQSTQKNGYKVVSLNGKTFLVHRLVAQTFIPNQNNYPIINHIDENRCNNRVDNLEWCTYSYNVNYGNCREKLRLCNLGKKHTIASKIKMSEAQKRRWSKK